MLVSCLLFEFMLFPLVASAFTIPNVKNPVTDILGNQNNNPFGTVGGTSQSPGDTVSPQIQSVQSCLVGAIPGAIVGGIAGTIVPGIGNLVGFAGGLLIGGAIGCLTSSTFFPQQGSAAFNTISNNIPIVGDFLKALAVALTFLGPLLAFLGDSVNYEFALLAAAPEIGVFLAPVQLITIFLLFFEGALFVRGQGNTG
jgi:hypothetical protein